MVRSNTQINVIRKNNIYQLQVITESTLSTNLKTQNPTLAKIPVILRANMGTNPYSVSRSFGNCLFIQLITKFTDFVLREILMSFSVRMNMRIICDQSVGSDTIPVIHGLKSISMAWVILGHTCIIAFKYSGEIIKIDFFLEFPGI